MAALTSLIGWPAAAACVLNASVSAFNFSSPPGERFEESRGRADARERKGKPREAEPLSRRFLIPSAWSCAVNDL